MCVRCYEREYRSKGEKHGAHTTARGREQRHSCDTSSAVHFPALPPAAPVLVLLFYGCAWLASEFTQQPP